MIVDQFKGCRITGAKEQNLANYNKAYKQWNRRNWQSEELVLESDCEILAHY